MQYQKKTKITKICIFPQSLCCTVFLIRQWLLMFTSLEVPCISWPSGQHLKLLEARFAAFMPHFEIHLGLFHKQEQPKFCYTMLGDACAPGKQV